VVGFALALLLINRVGKIRLQITGFGAMAIGWVPWPPPRRCPVGATTTSCSCSAASPCSTSS
jgi:hypothetical protein